MRYTTLCSDSVHICIYKYICLSIYMHVCAHKRRHFHTYYTCECIYIYMRVPVSLNIYTCIIRTCFYTNSTSIWQDTLTTANQFGSKRKTSRRRNTRIVYFLDTMSLSFCRSDPLRLLDLYAIYVLICVSKTSSYVGTYMPVRISPRMCYTCTCASTAISGL